MVFRSYILSNKILTLRRSTLLVELGLESDFFSLLLSNVGLGTVLLPLVIARVIGGGVTPPFSLTDAFASAPTSDEVSIGAPVTADGGFLALITLICLFDRRSIMADDPSSSCTIRNMFTSVCRAVVTFTGLWNTHFA